MLLKKITNEKFISENENQTFEIVKKIKEKYLSQNINLILLNGDIGVGKTTFVKYLLTFYGFKSDEVTSPSFSIKNTYSNSDYTFFHYDFYLLDTMSLEMRSFIWEDLYNAFVIIEWAQKFDIFKNYKNKININIFRQDNQLIFEVNK